MLTRGHIELLAELVMRCYNAYEDAQWTMERSLKRVREVITREGSFGLALMDGETLAGFAMGHYEQFSDGFVYDLVEVLIDKPYQRQGLGEALMLELESRAREKGAIMLEVQCVSDELHEAFYSKLKYGTTSDFVLY